MEECQARATTRWRAVGRSLCFLAVWGFSNGNLGHISTASNQLLASMLLIIFAASLWPARTLGFRNRPLQPLLLAGGILIAAVVLWLCGGDLARGFAVTLLLVALERLGKAFNASSSPASVYLLAAMLITLYVMLYKYVPGVWFVAQHASQSFSQAVTRLTGQPLLLGATASGFHLLVYFSLYVLSAILLTHQASWKRLGVTFVLAVGVSSVYLLIHGAVFIPLLEQLQSRYHLGHSHYHGYTLTALNTGIFLVILLVIPLWLFEPASHAVKRRDDFSWSRGRLAAAGLVLLGAFALTYTPAPADRGGTVYLYDAGFLNWDKPVFGRYGERAAGMFGLLPEFLQASGFDVKRSVDLSPEGLGHCQTLVLINLQKEFSPEDHEAIWDFVHRGGSLLALGDHTGIAGIREPFNALLRPVGVEFNFDSAHYLKDWNYGFELFPHQSTWGVKPDRELGISVGASLKIPASARPVIAGKYGFSDIGDANNVNQAFLGDRRYNKGELLGDLVLASASTYGRGKVLVFGDTSSFQNGALALSHQFVRRVFTWLASPASFLYRQQTMIGLLLLVAGLCLMLRRPGQLPLALPRLVMALLAGFFIAAGASALSYSNRPLQGNIACLDTSHLERVDYDMIGDRAFLGLSYNLMRNGYVPVEMREFSDDWVKEASLVVAVAPARPFSRFELKTLKQFMAAGGAFVLCAGWEEARGCQNVLSDFGLNLENVPLGPVEPADNTAGVHFHSAWPVRVDNPESTDVLCTLRDPAYPMIVRQAHGQGQFIFVADAGFLSNVNLETFREYSLENIAFLKGLLQPETTSAGETASKPVGK